MKKLLTFLLIFCLTLPICFSLACKDKSTANANEESKVVNVSLNPEIEFVLDENNVVVSVTDLNDDGSHIISLSLDTQTAISKFQGLSAKDAIQLFLELSKDNGYLITGDKETIDIEISGDNTSALVKEIKEKADKFLADNNINATIEMGEISKDEIIEKVKNCMREKSQEELQGKSHKELVELLKESRKETSKIFNPELKEVYYQLREEKINVAELDTILASLENLTENPTIASFVEKINAFNAKLEELKTAINENLIAEDSAVQQAKQAYVEAKKNLLDKRLELGENGISDAEKLVLDVYEQAVESAKLALETARATANTAINAIQVLMDEMHKTITTFLQENQELLQELGVVAKDVEQAKDNAKKDFKSHFESKEEFGDFIGHEHCHWHPKTQQNQNSKPQTSQNNSSSLVSSQA